MCTNIYDPSATYQIFICVAIDFCQAIKFVNSKIYEFEIVTARGENIYWVSSNDFFCFQIIYV